MLNPMLEAYERLRPLLTEERQLLADLRVALGRFDAPADDQRALDRSIRQLDDFFLLVVVGEFNAGKSAFINALLGRRLLPEGVTPTTAEIHLLRYGPEHGREALEPRVLALTAPVDLLREIHIVDTPGTNAIIREHEALTTDFIPRSDLVLFVTSADRPFTESERAFLQQIRDWGKKVIVVINKVDIFERPEDAAQVERFVAEHATVLLGSAPPVFAVSARAALRGKLADAAAPPAGGFDRLEAYVRDTLDQPGRIRLKLLNPLGVAVRLADRYLESAAGRLALLDEDVAMLDDVERQLALYEEDMARDFRLRMAEIDNLLLEMEQRGAAFFDEMLRLGRVFDLINRSRVQQQFEQQVVGDAPQQIERRVDELIDWLVESDLRQWQAVTDHLAERRRRFRERIVGEAEPGRFHYDRTRLIESVGREAQRVVDTYDKAREARALAEGARAAVAAAAAMGAGALGVGALVTVAATTAAADVTGLLTAGVLATVGLFIMPAKRRRARDQMHRKVADLRERLGQALRSRFDGEVSRSARRIRESIAPYERFVRAERSKLTEARAELQRIHDGLGKVRGAVQNDER